MSQQDQSDPTEKEVLAYDNTIDQGTWRMRVVRTEPYKGRLVVTRLSDGTEILNDEVGIVYDAVFGPDAADVGQWVEQALAAIDAQPASQPTDKTDQSSPEDGAPR